MGLRNKAIITIFFMAIGVSLPTYAAWQGPTEIVSGSWGANSDQFGVEYGDTNDSFPTRVIVLLDGGLIIRDIVNGRKKIYTANGTLLRAVKCAKNAAGEWNDECRIKGDYIQTTLDGNIWTGPEYLIQQGYSLYSPTGQLLKTSNTRPLELGVVSEEPLGNGKYKTTVKYEDATYMIISAREYERFVRDKKKNLYAMNPGIVEKFSPCGKLLGRLDMPEAKAFAGDKIPGEEQYVFIHDEYGAPVVDVNGNVYTWKRTPTKYSILKWTWVDDPNVPSGPDAPSGLTVTPSINGLYLTWTASPNDPGCVTGYEVARATSSGGVFSTVGTVDKGVVKYNDATASTGTTYYYKVRAKAGTEYSPYTSEVSGRR